MSRGYGRQIRGLVTHGLAGRPGCRQRCRQASENVGVYTQASRDPGCVGGGTAVGVQESAMATSERSAGRYGALQWCRSRAVTRSVFPPSERGEPGHERARSWSPLYPAANLQDLQRADTTPSAGMLHPGGRTNSRRRLSSSLRTTVTPFEIDHEAGRRKYLALEWKSSLRPLYRKA